MSMLESPIAQRNGQTMLCPICQISLKIALEGHGEVDFCEKCHGMWVDFMEERHVFELKPQVFTIDELRRLHNLYHPLGKIDPVRYIPCPVCKELMLRKNWGNYSGVVVNKCEKHGTWFSSNEQLEKIKEYIAYGGIEYEKLQMNQQDLAGINHKILKEIADRYRETEYSNMHARFYKFLGF